MRAMSTVPGIRWTVQVREVMQEKVSTVPGIRWVVQVRDVMQEIVS